jgi:hypothetical protein
MARGIGRRPIFFFALVVVSLALYFPTPSEFRWVCLFLASLAGFWAVALGVEDLLTPSGPRRPVPAGPSAPAETPFGPPPPPGSGS